MAHRLLSVALEGGSMFSKHVFLGVLAAAATMTLLACQPSFKMTCDPTDPNKISGCKESNHRQIATPLGNFQARVVSVNAVAYSPEGFGGTLNMTIEIKADQLAPRNIVLNGAGGTIPSQGNEPKMSYIVKCLDGTCATSDVGVYFLFTDSSVKVFAARIQGSSASLTTLVPVDGTYIRMNDPTSAIDYINPPMP